MFGDDAAGVDLAVTEDRMVLLDAQVAPLRCMHSTHGMQVGGGSMLPSLALCVFMLRACDVVVAVVPDGGDALWTLLARANAALGDTHTAQLLVVRTKAAALYTALQLTCSAVR